MVSESKLLKLFKLLLGDKYKIVSLSDDEKNKISSTISNEDLSTITDFASGTNNINDGLNNEDEEDTETGNDYGKLPHYNIIYNSNQEDESSISEEAQALFERDKQKYGISAQKEEPLETDEQELINEAQEAYDQIVRYLSDEIQHLNDSKAVAKESYVDILRNSDRDDPYRAQIADNYNPLYIQEQINYYNRIKQDPFYGRFKLLSQDGKTIDVYIGRIAFEENDMTIISPWSEIGKAFRQNRANFYAKGKYYNVINKYTYITKNGRVIGVKDESPR